MGLTFHYLPDFPRRQLDEADILRCEEFIGRRLPKELREFLLVHDGPAPDPAWIALDEKRGRTWLGPIYSFKSVMGPTDHRGRADCIEASTYSSRSMERLPRRLIVFGSLLTQPSTLLISTGWLDYGAVYAWSVGMKWYRRNQRIRLARSFGEFLTLLKDPPPEFAERHRQQVAERSAARQHGAELRPPADLYGGSEARLWLRRNRNPGPLASNHFAGPEEALGFVEELYKLGATRVIVPESAITPEDDDGPYADALVVFLPPDPERRAAVCRRCERELDEPQRIEESDTNPVFLWWD